MNNPVYTIVSFQIFLSTTDVKLWNDYNLHSWKTFAWGFLKLIWAICLPTIKSGNLDFSWTKFTVILT